MRGVPRSLEYPEITLPQFLVDTATQHPEHIATTLNGNDITYQEIHGRVNAFARALGAMGVKRGDRVALILPNSPTYVIAAYAVMKLGAVVVNINVNGFFYIVDRKDDLIISSGFNVYPSDVEKVLVKHAGVRDAGVVGVPDPIRGESIAALLLWSKGRPSTGKSFLTTAAGICLHLKYPVGSPSGKKSLTTRWANLSEKC